MFNFKEICAKVVDVCRETGAFIRQEAEGFTTEKIEHKGLNDLVSYVDKEAEKRLLERLAQLLPEAQFVAEEKGVFDRYFYQKDEYCWIVDPLDGTTNFIHGVPTYAISVALYCGSEPMIGVVYEINRDEMFYTYIGAPAFLNGKEIRVSAVPNIAEGLLATGFPYYDFQQQETYMRLLAEVLRSCHGVRRIGAAAVDLAYVACGRFEAFFEYNLKPWDIAAVAFLVQQAGGKCCDFEGGADIFADNAVIAANAFVQEEMLVLIKKHFGGV